MPKIAEIKEIDGCLWIRINQEDYSGNGITIWTPEEVQEKYNEGYEDGQQACIENHDRSK